MKLSNVGGAVLLILAAIAVLELHLVNFLKVFWVLAWHDTGMRAL